MTRIILPTKEKTRFLICDDIRQEVGDKLSFIGVYTGGDIVPTPVPQSVNAGAAPPALSSLSCYFGFTDGEGDFPCKILIKSPNNQSLAEYDFGNIKKERDKVINIIFRISPFPLTPGTYKAIAILDTESYENEIIVRP